MDPQKLLNPDDPEPRWPALVALLAVGGLYEALPEQPAIRAARPADHPGRAAADPDGPDARRGHHRINRVLGLGIDAIVTVFLIASVVLLVHAVLDGHIPADRLLRRRRPCG